ncbi:hypothetical protein J6590_059266 [Homalodisca vitripennis]|nr:hypothetical protein J6590_059266 [Homalodisca vitripennis]
MAQRAFNNEQTPEQLVVISEPFWRCASAAVGHPQSLALFSLGQSSALLRFDALFLIIVYPLFS